MSRDPGVDQTSEDPASTAPVDGDIVDELSSITSRYAYDRSEVSVRSLPPPELAPEELAKLEQLVGRLTGEASSCRSPRRSAALLHELGRVYEYRLGQPERALHFYREAHDRFPGLAVNTRALTRLLLQHGDFPGCVHVLGAELSTAASPSERVAVLVDRAVIRMRNLGDLDGARDDLLRALEIHPEEAIAADVLAELYERLDAHEDLAAALLRRLPQHEGGRARAAVLSQIAAIHEAYLSDDEGATSFYIKGAKADSTDLRLLQAALRTARRCENYSLVAQLSRTLADHSSADAATTLLWEAGNTYLRNLNEPDSALECLERASQQDPENAGLLVDLASLYAQQKKWGEAATALGRAQKSTSAPATAADIAFRLAKIRYQRLKDMHGAIDALCQAVDIVPEHHAARTMLGRIYARHGRHEDLIGLLRQELSTFTDQDRRAMTAYRIGDIYEHQLGEPEHAIAAYEQALVQRPGYRPALRGLARVYDAFERHEDLVGALERQLPHTDPEERLLLLRRIAEVWERNLANPAAGIDAHKRLLDLEPSNLLSLRALRNAFAGQAQWEDLAQMLRAEANQTKERWRKASLLTDLGDVYQRQLSSTEQAVSCYQEALQAVPSYQPALMAAGRIFYRASDHASLLRLHQAELEATSDPTHRAWLLAKIGRNLWGRLGDTHQAAAAYAEAFKLGEDASCADQLLRIYRCTEDRQQMLKILMSRPSPDTPDARALHHRRIAALLHQEQRLTQAMEHLRLAVDAGDDAALHELIRLHAKQGSRRTLLRLYQAELENVGTNFERLTLLHRLARMWSTAQHDLHRASEAYDQILRITPKNHVALRQLEILCARLERWADLAAVLELERENTDDTDFLAGCGLQVAAIREDRLDDLVGAAQNAVEVLERRPTHSEALATLEAYSRQTQNSETLLQVLGRQLKGAQAAAEQAALLVATAAVHANNGDTQRSCEFYRLAIDVMPSYIPALRGWYRAAQELDDRAQMAHALELEARASQDHERQAECDCEAAQLWEQHNETERAAKAYWRVLQAAPLHQQALRRLNAVLNERQDFRQLIEVLDHRCQHATDINERRDLLARMADLQRSKLHDVAGARRTINRALALCPDDRQLLTTLAELCRTGEDFKALAEVNQALVELTDDPVLLKALHFELGHIWEERLSAPDKAAKAYKDVLEIDPEDLGALGKLASLLRGTGEWEEAARVTEQMAQKDNDRARVKGCYLALSRIYVEGFQDTDKAIQACRRALALDPGDADATDSMADLLARNNDLRGLNAHLESTLTVHRARLERDPFEIESYRAILRAFERQDAADRCYVVHSLLHAIGAGRLKSAQYVEHRRGRAPGKPRRPLTAEEIEGVIVGPRERGALRQILLASESALRKALELGHRSPRKGITKITSRTTPGLAAMLRDLGRAIGGCSFNAYLVRGATDRMHLDDTSPPSLLLGSAVEQIDGAELRFRLARLLGRIKLQHVLAMRMGADDLGRALRAVIWAVNPNRAPTEHDERLIYTRERVEKVLTARVRTKLEPTTVELAERDLVPSSWLEAMQHSEDRLALAVCGDIMVAARVLQRDESGRQQPTLQTPEALASSAGPRTRRLLTFAVSEEHLTLRERLGMAVFIP